MPADAPRVSFLVPAWNAAAHIDRFVATYRALGYPNRELVLCAGGEDGSYAIATRHVESDITVIEQHAGEGKQRALRRCYEHSRGELLFLTDIDCRPTDAVIGNLLRHVVGPDAAFEAVTGASCPLPEQMGNAFVATQWAVERASEPAHLNLARGLLGRNALLTRAAAEAAGGFRFEARSGTDYALARELRRAGVAVRFVAGPAMPTEYPDSPRLYVRKQARWIRNVFLLGRHYLVGKDVRASAVTMVLAPSLAGGVLLVLLRRACRGPLNGFLRAGLACAVAYAIANRLRLQAQAGVRRNVQAAVMHFAATQIAALRAGCDVTLRRERW